MTDQRRFYLERDTDVTGVSGTGRVADGVLWPDGTASLRWRGERPSTVHWDRMADAEAVHGHVGATRIVWIDPTEMPALDADVWWTRLGARIRTARERAGLAQEQLGDRIGLGRTSISNVESGRQHINAMQLALIAVATHTPTSVLLGEQPDRP